jgi:predicted phosphodiesterase
MSLIFIHLSDIHFGQEKGGVVKVHDDVKDEIIVDVRKITPQFPEARATGIIISGDIAYAGKAEEYDAAWQWLGRLTAAAGCDQEAVQVVPGNHDIDRDKIAISVQNMIDEIHQNGDKSLDKYLASELDREILYERFSAYRVFAEGYDCSLDIDGTVLNGKLFQIAEGKFIKFHGVNTALICSKSQEEGKLLLGQRQRVIPRIQNTETIIVAHHPLHWLQDSEDALKYIENRARVFISGHEHKPDLKVNKSKHNKELLAISAGAAVPPAASAEFNYCYNILVFDLDETETRLKIQIYPRTWSDDKKEFIADVNVCGTDCCEYLLKCPNFAETTSNNIAKFTSDDNGSTHSLERDGMVDEVDPKQIVMPEKQDQLILLRFFRDLSSSQRIELLVKMEAIPKELKVTINHTIETAYLRKLLAQGKAEQINDIINLILAPKI